MNSPPASLAEPPVSPAPVPPSSDEQLLDRHANGDRTALDELLGRYRQAAYRIAYRLLGHEADALDAVQEGYVKVLLRLDGFERRSSFKTWLLRVVSNAALDLGRQRGRREFYRLDGDEAGEPDAATLVWDDPSARLDRDDLRRALDAALAALPDLQRQTFVLHAVGGMSYKEVADELDIPIGTVMSRLYNARQRLQQALSPQLEP